MKNITVCDGFIGRKPGHCYSMGVSHPETFAAGTSLVLNSAEAPLTALTLYGWSTQDGTPSPENPVPIVSAGDEGEINVTISDGGTQSQFLTVSAPGGLPGIPVDASKLPEGMTPTYVDESGQAWVCDEVDFKRGKYVQRVKQIEMDGSSDERWTLQSINQHGIANFQFIDTNGNFDSNVKNVFCDRFMAQTSAITDTTTEGFCVSNKTVLYVRINQSRASTVEDFVNWLGDNPIVAIICIATPIETDLSDEEMAAYKALHTYSPTTTVSNDAGAWMRVGYYGLTAIQKLEKEALLINGGKS